MKISKATSLKGEITIPGDKSISHRGIMFGAIAKGATRLTNFLQGDDCLSTIDCFRKMGVFIDNDNHDVIIHGAGLHGLKRPVDTLNVGNSGTTMRLISGILAGQEFPATLTGDDSICSRPMARIITPLSQMNADIVSKNNNNCAPLSINGRQLSGIHYHSPVASAQVKSCVLLAGLYANGTTSITEPSRSRNHTELMLRHFGATINTADTTVTIEPAPQLYGLEIAIAGDISSAAYFIAAALIVPNSEVLIKNVGINPTRDGILRVCKSMGANITYLNQKESAGEPTADLLVKSSVLEGTVIEGAIIPTLIDELPIIAVLAAVAQGTTIIRNAEELKVKESNRLDIMVNELLAMGVDIEGTADGMIIHGGKPLMGIEVDSRLDHRIAMSFAIAGLVCDGPMHILRSECVDISYPCFFKDLQGLLTP